MAEGPSPLLYHEQQESKLCGTHSINTLLQGPYFTEFDLAAIAQELDQQEREMMAEAGMDTEEYIRFVAEDSANVAVDGDFSIQVLSKALEVWNLRCLPLDSPEAAGTEEEPHRETAFLCNLQSHWFTIRKVNTEWYNFNSLFAAPEHISQFYLSAFLSTLKQSGYSVFVVRGQFPRPNPPLGGGSDGQGRWLSPQAAKQLLLQNWEAQEVPHARGEPRGTLEDSQLAAALAASLAEGQSQQDFEDPELAAAIAASLADGAGSMGQVLSGVGTSGPAMTGVGSSGQAIPGAADSGRAVEGRCTVIGSEEGVPEEPPLGAEGVVELAIRLPSGSRVTRRFPASSTVDDVFKFVKSHGIDMSRHDISLAVPGSKAITAASQSLHDAELVNKSILIVRPRL